MPIYEYKCRQCGEISEVFQKFSDLSYTQCLLCDGQVDKIMSMNAFHLKGSGWYTTDYASKNTNVVDKSCNTNIESSCTSKESTCTDKSEQIAKKEGSSIE